MKPSTNSFKSWFIQGGGGGMGAGAGGGGGSDGLLSVVDEDLRLENPAVLKTPTCTDTLYNPTLCDSQHITCT